MKDFKFSKEERKELKALAPSVEWFSRYPYFHNLIDRIETIIQSRADADVKEDEFTVLMDKAVRMQELYRAQRYGLSDKEMSEIVEYLDDLRRIPQPPKQ